jgi:hypothetical protein
LPSEQGCGSRSGFNDFVDPYPEFESVSRMQGERNEEENVILALFPFFKTEKKQILQSH